MAIANKTDEIKVSRKLLKALKSKEALIGMLADAFHNSPNTIKRWIKNRDTRLLNIIALRIYKEQLGIDYEQATEQ